MPLYDVKCTECGKVEELLVASLERAKEVKCACGGSVDVLPCAGTAQWLCNCPTSSGGRSIK